MLSQEWNLLGYCLNWQKMMLVAAIQLLSAISIKGQIVETSGQYAVVIEEHMSRAVAREEAHRLAIVDALNNAFGTVVTQTAGFVARNETLQFTYHGNSRVKGNWLRTVKGPVYGERLRKRNTQYGLETEITVTCKVTIEAKPLAGPSYQTQISFRSCLNPNCETNQFEAEQDLFVNYRTSTSGFLAIYAQKADSVFRLLPYAAMDGRYEHAVPIQANKEYLLFSPNKGRNYFPGFDSYQTDELVMELDENDREFLTLHFLFSTEDFGQPILENERFKKDRRRTPKHTSVVEFFDWVGSIAQDEAFVIYSKSLTIEDL